MSTATAGLATVRHRGGRPGYWFTFRGVAVGLIAGSVSLWAICVVVSLFPLVGLSSSGTSFYAPWVIDGPWSLAAALAWGLLVSALAASFVRERMQTRTEMSISRVLTLTSVAAGGYGPWLLSATFSGRAALSLLVTPAILRLVVFEPSGRVRHLPARLELSRGRFGGLLVCGALGVVLPFALLHPFALRGNGGPGGGTQVTSGWLYDVQPGRVVQVESGLQVGLFPVTVTGVHVLGQNRALRVVSVAVGNNAPVPAVSASGLPVHIAARQSLWISYKLRLRYCSYPPASVTRIRVSYSELGLALTQTVGLAGNNTLLGCAS